MTGRELVTDPVWALLDGAVVNGDCVDLMGRMPAASVDAIVTDPPYGLEFMGKDWDRLDYGLPQENVWKGRRGKGGSNIGSDDSKPASRHHVALGVGKRHAFKRCAACGKRQFSGSPCECVTPEWEIEYPEGPPSSSVRAQRWHEAWAREAFRVLKPGAYLLAFGGSRTYHRLACAIEDAGFEVRDTLSYLYGSGFPKSLNVAKALDAAAGAEGEYGEPKSAAHAGWISRGRMRGDDGHDGWQSPWMDDEDAVDRNARRYLPATAEARAWDGWGTALKPAHEPIIVARKPLAGTVAANIAAHGTGAINVDGCRIEMRGDKGYWPGDRHGDHDGVATGFSRGKGDESDLGRWPANVVLDEAAAELLDEQSGELAAGNRPANRNVSSTFNANTQQLAADNAGRMDPGGASRFFYVAKASAAERNAGLDGFPDVEGKRTQDGGDDTRGRPTPVNRNTHPTVKPIALMRWLVRLVAPPGGVILDPFAGSGTTLCAAALEGVAAVGLEREAEYAAIARARAAWWAEHPEGVPVEDGLRADRERRRVEDAGQLRLLG